MIGDSLHPVDWFNMYGKFSDVFSGVRNHHLITENECAILTADNPTNKTTFKHNGWGVEVLLDNPFGLEQGGTISMFMLLCAVKFKHDQQQTISFIQHDLREIKVPYIRVGVDYFKVIQKQTRYGGSHTEIKRWKIEVIKSDHSKTFLGGIPRFDDFIIVPDNKDYKPIINNCYNLYSPFCFEPTQDAVSEAEIPTTINFLKHIFGEHFEYGLTYFKVLYEHPKQILPILCLVSAENETGKTTFINFLEMIFGGNYTLISPDDLTKSFNLNYATKNIIAIEETFVEKQAGVEKLKSLSTGKSIQMARKFIDDQALPFFGKIILCTNKVKDFMRINSREIRFWIREVPKIQGKKNVNIETDLFNEIPKFLKFLKDLPAINFDNGSRMVFTQEQIQTKALTDVKEESKSGLYKDLEILIDDLFDNKPIGYFCATPKDIKEQWFTRDSKVSINYIRKVLIDEFGMTPHETSTSYTPFEDYQKFPLKVTGRFFYFERKGPIPDLIEPVEPPF